MTRRATLCASVILVILLFCCPAARCFPLFYSVNGSALLTTAHGADVVLRPDAGGTVVAAAPLAATAGLLLNGTRDEAYVARLMARVAALEAQTADLTQQPGGAAAAPSPPLCGPPGGRYLQWDGAHWRCVCDSFWFGEDCSLVFNVSLVRAADVNSYAVGALGDFAFDSAGNIVIVCGIPSKVCKLTIGGQLITLCSDGTWAPVQEYCASPPGLYVTYIAVDSADNIYVSGTYDDRNYMGVVRKVTPNGTVSMLANGFFRPGRLAVDSHDNIYVTGSGALARVAPDGTVTDVTSIMKHPVAVNALTIDADDNMYLVAYDSGSASTFVFKSACINGSYGAASMTYGWRGFAHLSLLSDGPSGSSISDTSIAVDASGNVFMTMSGKIFLVTGVQTQLTLLLDGINNGGSAITKLAFDAGGTLHLAATSIGLYTAALVPGIA